MSVSLPTDHNPYRRPILLAAAGLSPQIITETLFAIARESPEQFPGEVHVVTTEEGARRIRLSLLSENPGWLRRFIADWKLPPVLLDEQRIHVLRDEHGAALADIRSALDNRRAADAIVDLVRRLTTDPEVALHVSLAGGRKTLGFFLGYALSLYGRTGDRLSHVLVSEPFESSWNFFYPTPYESVIESRDKKLADCAEAIVTLADIPFVKLREGLPSELLAGETSFSRAVEEAQRAVLPVSLAFDLPAHCIVAGGERVRVTPYEMTLYYWLAERRVAGLAGLHWSEPGFGAGLLERYARVVRTASGDFERVETAVRRGLTKENIDPHKSRINAKIKAALGKRRAAPYLIVTRARVPGTPYRYFGLEIPAEAIQGDVRD